MLILEQNKHKIRIAYDSGATKYNNQIHSVTDSSLTKQVESILEIYRDVFI